MSTPAPPDEPLSPPAVAAALGGLVSGSVIAAGIVSDGRIEYANEGLAALFGLDVAEVQGRLSLADLALDADKPAVAESLRRTMAAPDGTFHLEFTGLKRDGGVVVVEMRARGTRFRGERAAAVALLDVTEKSHVLNRLQDLAFYDPLTDLPNRALFLDRLRHPIAAARRSGERAAVMLADLDGFKAVNDAHGHHAGDRLLKGVGQRLAACSRGTDTVARVGGDEFAAILPRLGAPEQAAVVASRMIEALREPFRVGPYECTVSISIGIALCPDTATEMDHLMALADAAMYQSKARGKNTYTFAQEGQVPPTAQVLIAWTDALTLGVEVLDTQHRRLVDLANALGDELREGGDPSRLSAAMLALLEHTTLHFRTEEGLMEAYEIPNPDRHRQEHSRLLADLRSLGGTLESTSMMLAMQHLKAWLVRHVDTLDRDLAGELRARGRF